MLVLTQERDGRIYIGKNIIITVVKIGDGRVKLGIDAPHGVSIVRQELLADPSLPLTGGALTDQQLKAAGVSI